MVRALCACPNRAQGQVESFEGVNETLGVNRGVSVEASGFFDVHPGVLGGVLGAGLKPSVGVAILVEVEDVFNVAGVKGSVLAGGKDVEGFGDDFLSEFDGVLDGDDGGYGVFEDDVSGFFGFLGSLSVCLGVTGGVEKVLFGLGGSGGTTNAITLVLNANTPIYMAIVDEKNR
jgi:hypothetical protein